MELNQFIQNSSKTFFQGPKWVFQGVDQKFKAWGGLICKDDISDVSSCTIVYNFTLSCKIFPYLDASIPHICHERRERRACELFAECKKNTEEQKNFTLNSL